MAELRIERDQKAVAPPGLDEAEQRATMIKAAKARGGVREHEELTALPLGMPPPEGNWTPVGNITAPGSGKPYKVFMKFPPGRGPGSKGSRHNHPTSDAGTMARVEHKPNKPTGTISEDPPTTPETPPRPKNQAEHQWLGSKESNDLGEAADKIRKVLDNPTATEKQITEVVQEGVRKGHDIAVTGGDENPMMQTLMEQVGRAAERVSDIRTSELESLLAQEERSPGSVPESKIKGSTQKAIAAEHQNQLLGGDKISARTMTAMVKAVEIIADRKADVLQNLIDRDKQLPGSVNQAQYSSAVTDFIGMVRQAELLGISRPKTENAMATVGEVLKALVRQKAEARQKLIEQKNSSVGGVSDQDIQRATNDLSDLKRQATSLGVSIP